MASTLFGPQKAFEILQSDKQLHCGTNAQCYLTRVLLIATLLVNFTDMAPH